MAINQKYSYNGYNPESQVIIDKKAELKQKLDKGVLLGKSFYKTKREEMLILNEQLKNLQITKIEYNLAMKLLRDELKQILTDNDALDYKGYSAACSGMKRGWKRKSLLDIPAKEFNNTEIIGSCFAQDNPFTDVFPSGITGVTFVNCNLNNCNIPAGNIIQGGSNKHHKAQNDGEEWIVNNNLKPIEPLKPKNYDTYNLSKDPKDLPIKPLTESIIVQAEKAKVKAGRKAKILEVAGNPTLLDELINSGKEL